MSRKIENIGRVIEVFVENVLVIHSTDIAFEYYIFPIS